jgi:putative acetyltransferase
VTIREATPSDRDALLDIWLRSVRATHTFLTEGQIQMLIPLVRDEALVKLEVWVLCAPSGEPAGFMALSDAHVEALFIAPEWIGKGGGTQLLDHARTRKGALAVDVNEQNAAALRFYRARGFEIVGRSPLDGQGNAFPLLHLKERHER